MLVLALGLASLQCAGCWLYSCFSPKWRSVSLPQETLHLCKLL